LEKITAGNLILIFFIKDCYLFKREHPALKNMKILYFFYFCGPFLPSWIRIRNLNADPGPATQINADPDPKPCFFELFSSKNAIYVCPIGYSGFNNLMGFTSKKLPFIILNSVY
jgi:hypothetical protein